MIEESILRTFNNANVLVTGGTGLIGRQVVNILSKSGANVRIVSLDRVKVDNKAEHILGDLTDFEFCKRICRDTDFLFHLAGIKGSIEMAKNKMASHFVPTLMMNTNVLEAARINKIKKIVYTSSIGAYANARFLKEADYRLDSIPMDFAGWAKRIAEMQIYAYKMQFGLNNFAIVRPSNVYGPGDNFDPNNAMVIPSLMGRIYRKEDPLVVWGDGSAIRDIAYSSDVAEGVVLALYHGTDPGFVNLGVGKGYSIKEVLEALNSFIDFNYIFDPSKPAGFPVRVMDISLARERLGYDPSTSLIDGLKQTWEWFINNQGEYLNKKNYFTDASTAK